MIAYLDSPRGAKYWQPEPDDASFELKALGQTLSFDEMRGAECYRLGGATLFVVSPEMTELIGTAAASLKEWHVHLEDIPTATGLCYFQTPIAYTDGYQAPVAAICWTATPTGLLLTLYLPATPLEMGDGTVWWGTRPPAGLCFHGFLNVGWDEGEAVTRDAVPEGEMRRMIWPLITTWLLMGEAFVNEEVVYASRSSRRRSQKSGIPVTGVRVLTLRRGVASAGRDGPSEQREYHHRWIVRGHWRQQ